MKLAVLVTKEEHQVFTNAWRGAFEYGTEYGEVAMREVLSRARSIYSEYPAILKALEL